MKTHVIIISRHFPKTHMRAGENTHFPENILNGGKIHTLRDNYEYWKLRISQVQRGEAVLSVRYWSGKPYNSKQVEICKLDKKSRVGIQLLQMTPLGWFIDGCDTDFTIKDFAKNDGLSPKDFSEWFRGKITFDMEPIGIIHFTNFRY